MNAAFDLDHGRLASDSRFPEIARALGALQQIDSPQTFNRYCREACWWWDREFGAAPLGKTTARFTELLVRIQSGSDEVIPTAWGGVVVTLHEHPRVEKYLVIRKGGYLALEKHEQKDERLDVLEGAGLVLSRRSADQPLEARALASGDDLHFEPGMEHCLIGTENLLVFERSTDPKGMDQDLIFIYEPDHD